MERNSSHKTIMREGNSMDQKKTSSEISRKREPNDLVRAGSATSNSTADSSERSQSLPGALASVPFPLSRRSYAEAKKDEKEKESNRRRSTTYASLLRLQANRENMKARRARRASDSQATKSSAGSSTSTGLVSPLNMRGPALPAYEQSTQSAPVLLEARVVEEPALVHAEPLTLQPGAQEEEHELGSSEFQDLEDPHDNERRDSQSSDMDRNKMVVSRNWLYIAGIVMAIFIAWVAVNASGMADSDPKSEPQTESTTAANETRSSFPSNPPSSAPSSTPSNRPSHSPSSAPSSIHTSFPLPQFTLQAIAQDSSSPQARALEWVQQHPDYSSMPTWRKRQLMALSTFFYSTGGDVAWSTWSKRDWLGASIHECQWSGDRNFQPNCTTHGGDQQQSYQDLNLESDGLKGTIPPEISFLTDLTSLNLPDNLLSGPLPSQLGELTALTHLSLGGNPALTGSIPTQVGRLTALQDVALEQIRLTGSIPSQVGAWTSLTNLNLFRNQFSGSVPSEVGHMTLLEELWLEENLLDGLLPTELGLLTALTKLSLNENKLDGPVPKELGQLTNLIHLWLFENQFTGVLPDMDWPLFHDLESFYVYNNHVSGTIPTSACGLTALTSIWIECGFVNCTCPQCTCQ